MAQEFITPPPIISRPASNWELQYHDWFQLSSWLSQQAFPVIQAGHQANTTALRPVNGLWVGRIFFDTTLNKPVWVKTVGAPAVWVDATGAAV